MEVGIAPGQPGKTKYGTGNAVGEEEKSDSHTQNWKLCCGFLQLLLGVCHNLSFEETLDPQPLHFYWKRCCLNGGSILRHHPVGQLPNETSKTISKLLFHFLNCYDNG